MQGQGFENVADETLFWCGPWPEQESDGVRVARWDRDQLGYIRALGGSPTSQVVSAPIELEGQAAAVFLNVDGISQHSQVSVEVLDQQFAPLPGYSRNHCLTPRSSGLNQPVQWLNSKETIDPSLGPVRIRVQLEGACAEDTKLYAVYLKPGHL
jgi:hypothetical protein